MTFTEKDIEAIKGLCTSAVELCERRSAFHKLGANKSVQHTIDGVVVDIPLEKLESISISNTAIVDSKLLAVLNYLVFFTTDYFDCKGKKNQKRETVRVSSPDKHTGEIRMRIYQAIARLGLPIYVVNDINEAREKIWNEVSKMCGCFRSNFDNALEKVIAEVSEVGNGAIEEDVASCKNDTLMVDFRKKEIKARFKDFAHTPLKLLNSKDLHHEFWLKLCVYYGTDKELFEKELIECLHEEYGYNIDSLNAMKSTTANAGEL